MVTVHVQPKGEFDSSTPVMVTVDRDLLDGLDADCANFAVTGAEAFWVASCEDPVEVWFAVDTDAAVDLEVGVGQGETDQRPQDVFVLFDDFDSPGPWVDVGTAPSFDGHFGPSATGSTGISGPVESFVAGLVLSADVEGPSGAVELGCGTITDVDVDQRQLSGWSYRWVGNTWSVYERNMRHPIDELDVARSARDRFEVARDGTLFVNGDQVRGRDGYSAECSVESPMLIAGGGTRIDRMFLRPDRLRVASVRTDTDADTDTDTDTDVDTDTDTDSDSASGGLVADPGCRCDGGGGGGVWVGLLAALAARRRRLSVG